MDIDNKIRPDLIAPCGMNCGICYAYLRDKNHCPGCREASPDKPAYCVRCIISNCELLRKTGSGFCFDCDKYPCKRLKQLDKRYRTKYHMSMLENLEFIKEKGLAWFVDREEKRWTCPFCGARICVHREICPVCHNVWSTGHLSASLQ